MGIFKRLAIAYVTIAVCNKLSDDLQYMLRELPRECKKIKMDVCQIMTACQITENTCKADKDGFLVGFHY